MGGSSRRKARETDRAAAKAQEAQTKMAQELFQQSAPARAALFRQGEQFLSGNYDVTGTPMFGAGKNMLEDQFRMAQDSIIGNVPEGGGLSAALANADIGRARGLTDLTGALASDQMNRITGLASGGAVQGSNVMSQAAGVAAQRAQAAAQESAGKAQGAGSAAGRVGAAAMGKG